MFLPDGNGLLFTIVQSRDSLTILVGWFKPRPNCRLLVFDKFPCLTGVWGGDRYLDVDVVPMAVVCNCPTEIN